MWCRYDNTGSFSSSVCPPGYYKLFNLGSLTHTLTIVQTFCDVIRVDMMSWWHCIMLPGFPSKFSPKLQDEIWGRKTSTCPPRRDFSSSHSLQVNKPMEGLARKIMVLQGELHDNSNDDRVKIFITIPECSKVITRVTSQSLKRRGMSRHDLVPAQTSNVCITCHAAIACMCQTICDATSSNVLGRLVQCERKGGTRGGGLVYTPKG